MLSIKEPFFDKILTKMLGIENDAVQAKKQNVRLWKKQFSKTSSKPEEVHHRQKN